VYKYHVYNMLRASPESALRVAGNPGALLQVRSRPSKPVDLSRSRHVIPSNSTRRDGGFPSIRVREKLSNSMVRWESMIPLTDEHRS